MDVEILVPSHISIRPPPINSSHSNNNNNNNNNNIYQCLQLRLQCHYGGVVWYGLAPILLEAPSNLAQRLIRLLLSSYNPFAAPNPNWEEKVMLLSLSSTSTTTQDDNLDDTPLLQRRRLQLETEIAATSTATSTTPSNTIISISLWLQPPQTSNPDSTFNSLVNRVEHQRIKTQTLSAWMSTLGGGYFFCRRLSKSLLLSQQQRKLALQLNDDHLVRQCQVNEIFNWLYIGNFPMALTLIVTLEQSTPTYDTSVHQQCYAARVLLQRLQTYQSKLKKYRTQDHGTIHAVDDYQRIRLVVEE